MLSWICPDCGCDCAPTDQECPDCSDLVQAGMVALARAVQEQRDSFPPPPEIPLQGLVAEPRRSIAARPTVPAAPRYVEPEPEPILPSRPVLPLATQGLERDAMPVISLPPPVPVPVLLPVPVKTPHRAILPGWLISLLVAMILSLGGAALVRNMEMDHKAEAASKNDRPAVVMSPATSDHTVEVTALRVLGGPRFGYQLQYIVVNHSPADLASLTLRIAVRSTDSRTSAPLFTISAPVTGLAAYSSREMTTAIEDVRGPEVPEWDRLKAEVQVGKQ